MTKVLAVLILITCISCSSKFNKNIEGSSTQEKIITSGKIPKWVYGAVEYCDTSKLCVVGEGVGVMAAEANARKSIAKIFATHVQAKSTFSTSSSSKQSENGVVTGSINNESFSQVQEATNQILEGVILVKKHKGPSAIYVMAELDKRRAAKRLMHKMDQVDTELIALYKDDKRSSLNKALKKYQLRKKINDRYEFLAEHLYPEKVTYAQILTKKKEFKKLNIILYVALSEVRKSGEIKDLLIKNLLDLDYKVTTNLKRSFQFKVIGKLIKEKLHMNVAGFFKYKFTLHLEAVNNAGEKLGAIDIAVTEAGRSLGQAYEKAIPKLENFIVTKLDELNID